MRINQLTVFGICCLISVGVVAILSWFRTDLQTWDTLVAMVFFGLFGKMLIRMGHRTS